MNAFYSAKKLLEDVKLQGIPCGLAGCTGPLCELADALAKLVTFCEESPIGCFLPPKYDFVGWHRGIYYGPCTVCGKSLQAEEHLRHYRGDRAHSFGFPPRPEEK